MLNRKFKKMNCQVQMRVIEGLGYKLRGERKFLKGDFFQKNNLLASCTSNFKQKISEHLIIYFIEISVSRTKLVLTFLRIFDSYQIT